MREKFSDCSQGKSLFAKAVRLSALQYGTVRLRGVTTKKHFIVFDQNPKTHALTS
jgi:hypothetical protein